LGGTVESKQGTNLLKYEESLGAYDEVDMSPAQLADLLANSTVTSNTTWTTSLALGVDVPILAEVVIQGNRYTVVAVCYEGTSVATVPIWYHDWDTLDPCDRSRFEEWESALELASMTESLWTVVLADDFQGTTSANNPLVVHQEPRCNSEDGYQADSNLCFRCQLGHFRTSPTGGCVACPADLYMSYVVFFAGVGVMAVTAIVMIHVTIQASKKKKERLSIMIKVFMSYMQILGWWRASIARGRPPLRTSSPRKVVPPAKARHSFRSNASCGRKISLQMRRPSSSEKSFFSASCRLWLSRCPSSSTRLDTPSPAREYVQC
jgi:hypothetical protein